MPYAARTIRICSEISTAAEESALRDDVREISWKSINCCSPILVVETVSHVHVYLCVCVAYSIRFVRRSIRATGEHNATLNASNQKHGIHMHTCRRSYKHRKRSVLSLDIWRALTNIKSNITRYTRPIHRFWVSCCALCECNHRGWKSWMMQIRCVCVCVRFWWLDDFMRCEMYIVECFYTYRFSRYYYMVYGWNWL